MQHCGILDGIIYRKSLPTLEVVGLHSCTLTVSRRFNQKKIYGHAVSLTMQSLHYDAGVHFNGDLSIAIQIR